MTTYDTPNVVALMNSYTASDFTTFANDCVSNWMNAWTSRFVLTPPYLDSISVIPPCYQQCFVMALQQCAIERAAGRAIDFSGFDIGTAGTTPVKWTLHIDVIWMGLIPPPLSVWWTHKP